MSRPNLKQLYEELQPISTKWKLFGTFLDVPNNALDPIHEDNKIVDEKLYTLCRQWLEIKPRGIWYDIVTALRKIKRLDLAHRLEEKFIKPPSKDTSNDRSDPMSTSLSLPYQPVVTSLPNPIEIDDKICTHVDVPKKLLESVDDFVIRFIFLLTEIQSALKQKLLNNNLNLEKLGRFICNLLSIRYKPLCVTEGRDEIDSLFRLIMDYLSFLHTHLFHSIDKKYLNCMFETEIEQYDDSIYEFMKSTVIIEFKEMIQSKRLEKSVPVILKLSRRWEKCMLDHLHHLVEFLFKDSSSFLKFSVIHHSVLTIVYIAPESLYLSLIVMATGKVRSMRLVGVLSVQVGIILMKFENVSNIEPSQALLIAAKVTHNKIGDDIKLLVNIGGDVNIKDKSGHTPLLIAAFKGNLFALNALLESKADPDIQIDGVLTALFVASVEGHHQCVKLLLQSKSDPDIQDNEGVTALHAAAQHGHHQCVDLLLKSKANPDMQTHSYGITSLHLASRSGHHECVDLLLQSKADPDIQDCDGITALYLASQNGNRQCVNLLLQSKANPDIQDRNRKTPLHVASEIGDCMCVDLLLQSRAGPNIQDHNGATALYIASQNGNQQCVDLLLQSKTNPDIQTTDSVTALYVASERGHPQCVDLLLQSKAKPDIQRNDSTTALHAASYEGLYQCVDLLL